MDLGLNDKVAIVSASSKGLGKATAKVLSMEGAHVVILSRNEENLKKAKEELEKTAKGRILPVVADVTKSGDIEKVVKTTVEEFGTVHILVNNAGGPPAGYFEDFNDDDWYASVDLLLMSSIRFIRLVLPYMKKQKWGRIINITSVSVKQPIDNLILSNSIRLAIVGMAKTLSKQLAKYNITINNVAPGYILTDRVRSLLETRAKSENKSYEDVYNEIVKNIPVGRIGEPEELGSLIAFLASERAGYITGATIQIDGGMTSFPL